MAKLKPGVAVTHWDSWRTSARDRLQEGCRCQDAYSTKRIEHQQILVAGHDAVRLSDNRDFEKLVIVGIAPAFVEICSAGITG